MTTMDRSPVDDITIVGGGTAGWLTAVFLQRALNGARKKDSNIPPVKVRLIESPNVPTVGVGESTTPGMYEMMGTLGLDETEFFRRCNVTFKCGVQFNGWDLDEKGKPYSYFHPFNPGSAVAGYEVSQYCHRFHNSQHVELGDMFPNNAVMLALRGPRPLGGRDYERAINYAYHLDAKLFANYLRDVAIARGVEHIVDDVVDVKQHENGFISSLSLKSGDEVPIQLVIDCTGFKGVISREVLKEPFESYGEELLCDKAVAVQIPHADPKQIRPYTTSTALSSGWVWSVPLYNRLGTGYVFSSAFKTDDEAVEEFMNHLGNPPDVMPRVLNMKIGASRRSWVKNCVSIGLSAGFVEPLEATGIYSIEALARLLIKYFPDKQMSEPLAQQYNRSVERQNNEIRDFIVLHYYLANRQEPFWKAARDVKLSDTLREGLELWQHALPTKDTMHGNRLFGHINFAFVLFGKRYFDDVPYGTEGYLSVDVWQKYLQELAEQKKKLVRQLPNHYDLLTAIRNRGEMRHRATNVANAPAPKPVANPVATSVSQENFLKFGNPSDE